MATEQGEKGASCFARVFTFDRRSADGETEKLRRMRVVGDLFESLRYSPSGKKM